MGLFESKKQRQDREARGVAATSARVEVAAVAARAKAQAAAWRRDRNAVLERLRSAEQAHAEAKRAYDRYAPGAQKNTAGEKLNAAAERLASVEREYAAVDNFSTWSKNN